MQSLDLTGIDLIKEAPIQEPQRQYYYKAVCGQACRNTWQNADILCNNVWLSDERKGF